jgi:hypothetical protein
VRLISGIKTLARLHREPFQEERYKHVTVAELLKQYLKLLKSKIRDYIKDKYSVDDRGNIQYVFTLPVLDRDKYAEGEKRMRDAAVAAGFPKNSEMLKTIREPDAAAMQVVHRLHDKDVVEKLKEIDITPQPGQVMCVVDSGGGTTDICFGKLVLNEDIWGIEHIHSMSLIRQTKSTCMAVFDSFNKTANIESDTQVGGDAIDKEIAFRNSGYRTANTSPHFPDIPIPELYKSIYDDKEKVRIFLNGIRKLKEGLSTTFEPNYDKATRGKLNISSRDPHASDQKSTYFESYFNSVDPLFDQDGNPLIFKRYDFDYTSDVYPVVESIWADEGVGKELLKAVEQYGCDFVVAIGGSTLMPKFVVQISLFTGHKPILELPADVRMAAVADGALWSYKPLLSGMLKQDLCVEFVPNKPREEPLISAFTPLKLQHSNPIRQSVSPGKNVELAIFSGRDSESRTELVRISRNLNGSNEYTLITEPSESGISINMELKGDLIPLWGININAN